MHPWSRRCGSFELLPPGGLPVGAGVREIFFSRLTRSPLDGGDPSREVRSLFPPAWSFGAYRLNLIPLYVRHLFFARSGFTQTRRYVLTYACLLRCFFFALVFFPAYALSVSSCKQDALLLRSLRVYAQTRRCAPSSQPTILFEHLFNYAHTLLLSA